MNADPARRLLALTASIAIAGAPAAPPTPGQSLAIVDVTVIDVESGERRPNFTVLVAGNRILAAGSSATTRVPEGSRVVDGSGRFLIPGLWDMHVHTAGADASAMLPVYVAFGVTGVRDMGADLEQLHDWRRRIERGTTVGPRIVMAGPILDGPLGIPMPEEHRRWRMEITDTARAERVVDSLAAAGADFIKVHQRLAPAVYRAIAQAARRRGLPLAGHVPDSVGVGRAIDAGQRSIEHLVNVPFPCTAAEVESLRPRSRLEGIFGSCTTEDQAGLLRRFAGTPVWHTPTLSVQERVGVGGGAIADDPGLRYVPSGVRGMMRAAGPFDLPPHPPDVRARLERLLEKRVRQVGALHAAGVALLAGTDAPGTAPGWSLHRELALLVRAGLSPAAALRAATTEPARYLMASDSLGTIGPGKIGDLVLLDADPLAAIGNSSRIRAVVANGRLFERAELDRLLADAEAIARRR